MPLSSSPLDSRSTGDTPPPRTPHFGGLWEAAVRGMKIQLRKNLKPHALRWDEMYSVLTEAEAILNSRPLAPLHTEESTEGTFLTAGQFLVGRPLKAPPVRPPSTSKYSLLRRWNLVTRIKADLWKTWSSSYLASCAQRSKWLRPGYCVRKGDIVFTSLSRPETGPLPSSKIFTQEMMERPE